GRRQDAYHSIKTVGVVDGCVLTIAGKANTRKVVGNFFAGAFVIGVFLFLVYTTRYTVRLQRRGRIDLNCVDAPKIVMARQASGIELRVLSRKASSSFSAA
ncbi:MAG: hypothetical protein OXF79_00875, partial [Chloroflexi bacterium]|nr:hypothetical protein [Chloroflexota bacterium]